VEFTAWPATLHRPVALWEAAQLLFSVPVFLD